MLYRKYLCSYFIHFFSITPISQLRFMMTFKVEQYNRLQVPFASVMFRLPCSCSHTLKLQGSSRIGSRVVFSPRLVQNQGCRLQFLLLFYPQLSGLLIITFPTGISTQVNAMNARGIRTRFPYSLILVAIHYYTVPTSYIVIMVRNFILIHDMYNPDEKS